MKYATHVLSFVLVAAALLATSASCGGPGAGIAGFSEGKAVAGKNADETDDDDDTAPTTSSSSSGAAADPIFGTKAFAYTAPVENADDHAATHTGHTPLEGQNCVVAGCHLAPTAVATDAWAAAGTVYKDITGSAPNTQVEIGIVYPDNSAKSIMTDAQGNFWLTATDLPPAGSKVGIRSATGGTPRYMATPLAAGQQGCNDVGTCHGLATNRINIP